MFGQSMVAPVQEGQEPKVWSDLVHDTAIGKTKGTFDAVNGNQASVVISKPDAKSILGFMIGYCLTAMTDAENVPDLHVKINSKALGISDEIIEIANGGSDADANCDYSPMVTKFVPFKVKEAFWDKIKSASISFSVSGSVSSTGGLDVVIAVIHSDQEPDSMFAMELLAQLHSRISGGDAKSDAALAHAAGGTAVTCTALTIPAGTSRLRALLGKIIPNGITAGDPVSGFIEFIASGIPDFSPQLWPLCIFFNPALGTVAESSPHTSPGRYYPTRFPLTGSEVTVTVKTTCLVTQGTAPDVSQALAYE